MRRTLSLLAAAAAIVLVPGVASAGDKVPFNDLQTVGGIALCDRHGNAVTSGSIHDKPFVEKAVSAYTPDKEWTGDGRSAVLYAYQPRKEAYPDQWNGDSLTAASAYDGRPTAVATALDFTLADYLREFPTKWDDLVQLRLYWGARSVGFDQRQYASVVLKVDGDRWTAIDGTEPGCGSGKASSTEVTVAGLDPVASASPHPGASSSAGSHGSTGPSSGATGATDTTASSNDASSGAATAGRTFALTATGIAVAALLALGAGLARRRLLTR